jgi:hypothetical protein
MDPPFHLVETAFATYLDIPVNTNQGRCFFYTRGAHHGHCLYGRRGRCGGRGHRFRGRSGRQSPPLHRASPTESSNRSSEHAWMSMSPYTAELVHRSPSRRRSVFRCGRLQRSHLAVRIRRLGTQTEGVGVIPDMIVPAPATETVAGNASFGPQAGPATIHSFTAAAMSPGLTGPSTAVHPSFTAGTIVARCGAPPFFSEAGRPPSTSSTTATQEATAAAPSPFGCVGVIDRRPGIRRGIWSPVALGLSSSGN